MTESFRQLVIEERCLAKTEGVSARERDFAALVSRHSRFVFQVAYAVLRRAEDAEDAAQETFLKLYRTNSWRRMENERAYLARAAWRTAVGMLPSKKLELPAAESRPTPEELAIAGDWTAAVHRLIDALPEELRRPIALTTVEELSSREIAETMGIPEGTVRTRLMRARELLKLKLRAIQELRHGD